MKVGKVMRVIGPVVDVEFFSEESAYHLQCDPNRQARRNQPHPRGGSVPGGERGALHRHVHHGRFRPGHGSRRHGRVHHHARGQGDARKGLQSPGRDDRQAGRMPGQEALSHPSVASVLRGTGPVQPGLRDRAQGDRPPRALRQRRQGRPLRRRGRGQDRSHHGADPEHRHRARRLLRLRRRGRADPRRKRPRPRPARGHRQHQRQARAGRRANTRPAATSARPPSRPHQRAKRAGVKSCATRLSTCSEDSRLGMDPIAFRRARHVITENHRTTDFAAALEKPRLHRVAASSCTPATPRCATTTPSPATNSMPSWKSPRAVPGVYGARMTGGGFGGCMRS